MNIGGKKVSPIEVEKVLNTYPGIKESAVVANLDSMGITGNSLKAFLVLDTHSKLPEIKSDLIRYLRDHLESYKVPVEFEVLKVLPFTNSGKLKREKLRR